jgi:hypothetical protein
MHTHALGQFRSLLLDGSKQCVSEVSLAGWASLGLHVVPQVVVLQLEHAGEKGQESTVDRVGQILYISTGQSMLGRGMTHLAERSDLVHEGQDALWEPLVVCPFTGVPVELLDTVGDTLVLLRIVSSMSQSRTKLTLKPKGCL